MKYKKGATLSIGMILAVFLAIIFIIFFVGGGAGLIFDITKFIKNVPTYVWVIFGVILLFRMLKK